MMMLMEERRLNEAAIAGNTTCLLELLQEDALILDRVMVSRVDETPLHIAAMLGHLDFAREILSRKPELTCELNSQGFSPLHLASAKGHLEMVKELLNADLDACMLRGPDGGTALHEAGSKGRIGVIKELISAKTELAWALTDRGETVLHVCVNHNQIEAFKLLLEMVDDEKLLKSKDHNGNTVLHLAVARRQIQMVKLLLSHAGVGVNVVNNIGLSALDVLLHSPTQLFDMEIGEILRGAGASRANNYQLASPMPPTQAQFPRQQNRQIAKNKKEGCVKVKDANTLMVVATLIAAITFVAGLVNAPNIFCTRSDYNCNRYNHSNGWRRYVNFLMIDTVGFVSSMAIVVLIISGFPFQKKYLMWVLDVIMLIAVSSVVLLFTLWFEAKEPDIYLFALIRIFWFVLLGLLCLWQVIRFGIWILKKYSIIKCKRGDVDS